MRAGMRSDHHNHVKIVTMQIALRGKAWFATRKARVNCEQAPWTPLPLPLCLLMLSMLSVRTPCHRMFSPSSGFHESCGIKYTSQPPLLWILG